MQKVIRTILGGSAALVGTSALSYILGFVRDRMFAHTFGASRVLDAYNAAFLLPDFLLNVFVASGIAAAFVPLFTQLLKTNRARSGEYANAALTAATSTMAVSAAVLIVFARPLSYLAAPGFSGSDRVLLVELLRVLALSPILFAASNAIGAMLIAERRFLFYGLSPVLYNLGIILGTVLLVPRFGIMGVAIGTLCGAILHLLIRMGDILRTGWRPRFSTAFHTPEFRRTLWLMLPKMVGHPIELATFWGFSAMASNLAPGSVAILNFARNFQSVPVSIIGIAIATATFPLLASAVAESSLPRFRQALSASFWLVLITSYAAALTIFFIRTPLITLAFGGKAFGHADVIRTATLLGIFTLAMPTESLVHVLARAYYATKNTFIPVVLSVVGFAIAMGLGILLIPLFDIFAIPLAFFAASAVETILLMALFSRRLRVFS